MARLSTHVLDTASGKPAEGIRVDLFVLSEERRALVCTAVTNADGRTSSPLLAGDTIQIGVYELVFHAAEYLRAHGHVLTDPPFLDEVTIRFGISEAAGNYHVPLLLSPYGYSTYKGS